MKVYIVTEGCYSDYHIEAVFDSYGKAVAYVEAVASKYRGYSDYQIETYDTESIQVAEERRWFKVHMEGDEWTVAEVEEPAQGDRTDVFTANFWKKDSTRVINGDTFHISEYNIDVEAKDKEHALKIARDKFARLKANKAGIY